jgi:hypothetical protein
MKHSFSSPEKVQAIKFSINMKYLKPIIIISIYRVADTPTSFIKQLEAETLQSNDKEMFILGDLNIDQLSPNENQLKPLITSLGLHQLIKTPTRVTDKTKTLIDLIITNSPHCHAKNTGVIRCGLSDHDIVFAVRKVKNTHKPAFETREVRDFKNVDIHAVETMIRQAPWWCIKMSEEVDNKFELFFEIVKIIMNTHTQLKKIRVKTTSPTWMTKEYKSCLTVVDKLKNKAVRTEDQEDWAEFKKLRNRCENIKRKLKMQSNLEHINESSTKCKTAWRIMNKEMGKQKSNGVIKKVVAGSKILEDEKEIANAFCDYFAETTTKDNSLEVQDFKDITSSTSELENSEITLQEVLNAIKYLKTNKPVEAIEFLQNFTNSLERKLLRFSSNYSTNL